MSRKIGKSPALAAPYGAPPAGLTFIGVDLATGPDVGAVAIASRKGTHVVMVTGENPSIDRLWISGLNANRKPDRETLAMAFTMIAENRGATVERRDEAANPGYSGQGIALRISCMGVGAMVDIDNIHGGVYALVHWHNSECRGRTFTTRFCNCVGADNAGRAHHKATSFPSDWYSLAMFLDAGLMLAARGEAFD